MKHIWIKLWTYSNMFKPYDTLQSLRSYLQNANNYSLFFLEDFVQLCKNLTNTRKDEINFAHFYFYYIRVGLFWKMWTYFKPLIELLKKILYMHVYFYSRFSLFLYFLKIKYSLSETYLNHLDTKLPKLYKYTEKNFAHFFFNKYESGYFEKCELISNLWMIFQKKVLYMHDYFLSGFKVFLYFFKISFLLVKHISIKH